VQEVFEERAMKYKRVAATRFGSPEVLHITEHDLCEPSKGQVRIKVLAASVCRPDIAHRTGETLYSGTPMGKNKPPFVPGYAIIGDRDDTAISCRIISSLGYTDKEATVLSPQTIRVLIAGSLLAHGIAHAVAISALITQSLAGPSSSVVTVQSWLFPSLSPNTAAIVALPFWIVSALGFLGASASFWGVGIQGNAWRRLAVASAIISILGIALFGGIWPGTQDDLRLLIHPLAAMSMNIAILATQLWLHWPPQAMFGK
jgi:hypothetical protein